MRAVSCLTCQGLCWDMLITAQSFVLSRDSSGHHPGFESQHDIRGNRGDQGNRGIGGNRGNSGSIDPSQL